MSYEDKLNQSSNRAHTQGVAKEIWTRMGKLRKSMDENRKRRWIWELMQNANDVGYLGQDTEISIEWRKQSEGNGSALLFSHNGKPFTADDIRFLIEQISTKDPDRVGESARPPTGKYGTGFLTTHLLSEKVDLKSVIKDEGEDHKFLNVTLNRTGRKLADINASVENSLEQIKNLDRQSAISNFDPTTLNTTFEYPLDTEGENVADIGLKDLRRSIAYVLTFVETIQKVDLANLDECYTRRSEQSLPSGIDLTRISKSKSDDKEILIASLSEGDTTIAIEVEQIEKQFIIKRFDPQLPKLFCNFPLIGTENFGFPVLINNMYFNPTEPRDGIDLGEDLEPETLENKRIIQEAIGLYFRLLEIAIEENWGNIHLLANIPNTTFRDWLSKEYYKDQILDAIRTKLEKMPIVQTEGDGLQAILNNESKSNIYFPSHPDGDIRDQIWELSYPLFPSQIPKKALVHEWYDQLWGKCYKQSLWTLSQNVSNEKTLDSLCESLGDDIDLAVKWLNDYYTLILNNRSTLDKIKTENLPVFLNQNGEFIDWASARIDIDLESPIKDILEMQEIKIRSKLIDNRTEIAKEHGEGDEKKYLFPAYTSDQAFLEINSALRNETVEKGIRAKAAVALISLFSRGEEFPTSKRENIYDFCSKILKSGILERRNIDNWKLDLWAVADNIVIKSLVIQIGKCQNVTNLKGLLELDENESLAWLERFVNFLDENGFKEKLNLINSPILPNQNGNFRPKDELYLDIDPPTEKIEKLKDIAAAIDEDFREDLLNSALAIKLPENREMNRQTYATSIQAWVETQREYNPSSETQKIYRSLLSWFKQYPDDGEELFGTLYKNKHRLFDDDLILESLDKADKIDQFYDEFGVSDPESLRDLIIAGQSAQATSTENENSANQAGEPITEEILLGYGFESNEQLQDAYRDPEFSSKFRHFSSDDPKMFQYAQEKFKRARQRVLAHLRTIQAYDCDDDELMLDTIFSGFTKNEIPITVVARPSDGGFVVIRRKEEITALMDPEGELWIDNGDDTPRRVTLGDLIRITGINKIPLT
jgi:hypothetical protein